MIKQDCKMKSKQKFTVGALHSKMFAFRTNSLHRQGAHQRYRIISRLVMTCRLKHSKMISAIQLTSWSSNVSKVLNLAKVRPDQSPVRDSEKLIYGYWWASRWLSRCPSWCSRCTSGCFKFGLNWSRPSNSRHNLPTHFAQSICPLIKTWLVH